MLAILDWLGSAFLIVLAFSVLIFVHELGHFLAALLVGIRPERFFIGFDIYGLGIKKEYKGCVYGIGLLPLGGYVKLAGQSDDPREQGAGTGAPDEYRSRPLWAQATVISAGVVMNMIFGFLLLFFAYLHGLPQIPPVVGGVAERSSAYYAGIEPGDRIISASGVKVESLNQFLEMVVVNPQQYFDLELQRGEQVIRRRLKGRPGAMNLNDVGVDTPSDAVVGAISTEYIYGRDFAQVLRVDDRFVRVGEISIPAGAGGGNVMARVLRDNPARIIPAVVERDGREVEIELPVLGTGAYDIGYSVSLKIDAVVSGGRGAQAGLRSGDKINALRIDGQRVQVLSNDDLIRRLQARAYMPVQLTVERDGQRSVATVKPVFMGWDMRVEPGRDTLLGVKVEKAAAGFEVVEVLVDSADWPLQVGDIVTEVAGEKPAELGAAVAEASCGELGLVIAGRDEVVLIRPELSVETGSAMAGVVFSSIYTVNFVQAGSLAARFLKPGDSVISTVVSPDGEYTTVMYAGPDMERRKPFRFKTPPEVLQALRDTSAASLLQGEVQFALKASLGSRKAAGIGEAAGMACEKSVDLSLLVYRILHRLVTRQIDVSNMTGPVGIFTTMKQTVQGDDPFMRMLLLLALISINLAVFNLLPFPVLDGGHLVFIVIEWIKGSPPSVRLREYSQYFGVACLLALMVYVTINDIGRIFDGFRASSVEKHLTDTEE